MNYGLPVRLNWAAEYRGRAMVVYGHTPTPDAEWVNNTVCIDTGCVFGGKLTALRYPEREFVEVPAARVYTEPARPLALCAGIDGQQAADDNAGHRGRAWQAHLDDRLVGSVRIEPENAAAALEMMSRFAIDPRWLIYLPPTMSPPETSQPPGITGTSGRGVRYFSRAGVTKVIVRGKAYGQPARSS